MLYCSVESLVLFSTFIEFSYILNTVGLSLNLIRFSTSRNFIKSPVLFLKILLLLLVLLLLVMMIFS